MPTRRPYSWKKDKGVADFCVIGEGLRGDSVILDKGRSYGFLFTYEGPLVHRLNKTWPGNDVQTLLSTQLLLNRVCSDSMGAYLHELQFALASEAVLRWHFRTSESWYSHFDQRTHVAPHLSG